MTANNSYVDVRVHLEFEEETYDIQGVTYTDRYLTDFDHEVIGLHNVDPEELTGIAESLAQVDRHQIKLSGDLGAALSEQAREFFGS